MSDVERNKGKLIPVEGTLREVAEKELEKNPSAPADDFIEDFLSLPEHFGFYVNSDQVYQIEWEIQRDTDNNHFADVFKEVDGSIRFHTMHYNGGGSWTEVMDSALEDLDENEES